MSAETKAPTSFGELTERFQCPGCVAGSDIACGKYSPAPFGHGCDGHVMGTSVWPAAISFALGLPKGFNRSGPREDGIGTRPKLAVRFWHKDAPFGWDKFNVAVWALVEDGFLFVRTYAPRTDRTYVDVVEGGTLAMVPGAVDVGPFHSEID